MSVFTAFNNTKKLRKFNITPYGELLLSVNLLGENLKSGLHFCNFFYHLKFLGWSSGFRAIDDLPRAHLDETELRALITVEDDISRPVQSIEEETFAVIDSKYSFKDLCESVQNNFSERTESETGKQKSNASYVLSFNILRTFDAYGHSGNRRPGILPDIIETLSSNLKHQSACPTYDRTKKQGLIDTSGDVDILGFESSKTL